MNNKTNIEENCICTTCSNRESICNNCKFDCASEEMCNCTIDGYTTQCSEYKTNIEEDIKIVESYLEQQDRKFVSEYRLEILQAIENILADREKYKTLYEKSLSDLVQVEAKANKYDSLVEKIKENLVKLQEEYELLLDVFTN